MSRSNKYPLVGHRSARAGYALLAHFRAPFLDPGRNRIPHRVIISLDGATLRLVDEFTASGSLNRNEGLGVLRRLEFSALQNITIMPLMTAPAHIAIATGRNAEELARTGEEIRSGAESGRCR